jgi:mono/diheme cytochrome c family protein
MRNQSSGATRRSRLLPFALCLLTSAALSAGCRQDMHDAPRYDPLEESAIWQKGMSALPIVQGTVARGHLNEDTLLFEGKVDGQPATVYPFDITKADLDRGEVRYNVYCAPCHDRTGTGNGMVVQRGYRQAASFHIDRLRDAAPGYIFDVITNGFGVMPDYKAQIPADDRWRIIAYVRALQTARHATTADVPASELGKLDQPATTKTEGEAAHKAGGGQE